MSENLANKYPVLIFHDGENWIAQADSLAGCFADGQTQEEALKNLQIAIKLWIETAISLGRDIPKPLEWILTGNSARRNPILRNVDLNFFPPLENWNSNKEDLDTAFLLDLKIGQSIVFNDEKFAVEQMEKFLDLKKKILSRWDGQLRLSEIIINGEKNFALTKVKTSLKQEVLENEGDAKTDIQSEGQRSGQSA